MVWTDAMRAKAVASRAARRKGRERWDSSRTTALSVALPELIGFAASVTAVKIAIHAETRLQIFSQGRGKRPSSLYVFQLAKGSTVGMDPASLARSTSTDSAGD